MPTHRELPRPRRPHPQLCFGFTVHGRRYVVGHEVWNGRCVRCRHRMKEIR